MTDITNATLRAAMTTRALSTLGACSPEWDNAVREVLRRQALYLSDVEFGPSSEAAEAFDRARFEIEAKHGRNWRDNPDAVEAMQTARAALNEAEEAATEQLLRPLWAAQRALALTPAPNLNAALFKSEIMAWEEIWNDNQLGRDGFEIVAEELARFAEGSA